MSKKEKKIKPFSQETWPRRLLIARIKQLECEVTEWRREAQLSQETLVQTRATEEYLKSSEYKRAQI
jgi:lambda repressor-like predicted transcriptional regulator